jgi:hypothetical protein
MAKKVAFSRKNLALLELANHHNDIEKALRLYFSSAAPDYVVRFAGYAPHEVAEELEARLLELELASILNILAAVEASFRIDYLQRCYKKNRAAVSVAFREIYRTHANRCGFELILKTWKDHTAKPSAMIISELHGAFKFRHWLAHGRYWTPKSTRKYDYQTVYALAFSALTNFPLFQP